MTADKLKFFLFCYEKNAPFNKEKLKEILEGVSSRLETRYKIDINCQTCLDELMLHPITWASLYSVLMEEIHKKEDKKNILGELEGVSWTNIPDFLEMFPKGKACIMLRDLRDVLVSFKKNTIAPADDYLVAIYNLIDIMDHCYEYQERYGDRFHCIRYEALKADPETEMRKMCVFLGVDYEPTMIRDENWMEGDKPWVNHQVSSFYKEGDFQNPVGRWRRLIQPEDLFLVEWMGKEQMRKFGIKPEGGEVSQEVFDLAIKKLTSSALLRECFKNWCETGTGVERYPLDPKQPKNWQKK